MPTIGNADRRDAGLRFGLGVAVVAAAFLFGGAPGALGTVAVLVGVTAVLRGRARRAPQSTVACEFLLVEAGDASIAAIGFRLAGDDIDATETLGARGWRILEPPLNGPLAPVRDVGVELHGDDRLRVLDLRGFRVEPYLIGAHGGALPAGWGRAAQESGYVLLLADPAPTVGVAPVWGTYALVQGSARDSRGV